MTAAQPKMADQNVVRDLLEHLSYNPESGVLTWIKRPWRSEIVVGTEAGGVRPDGYHYVCFRGRRYISHRLCWALHYGEMPSTLTIDHINMNRADNRIANLRLATVAENARNRNASPRNRIGFKGVSFDPRRRRFLASVTKDKRSYSLGHYPTAEAAALAYDEAVAQLHGEFARFNFPLRRRSRAATARSKDQSHG